MTSIDVNTAIIRMYEDIALTDSVDDATAKILQQWGEGQLRILANRAESEETFEEQFDGLRKIMKLVNRFTGGREDMSGEKRQKYLSVLVDNAQEMGYPAPRNAIGTMLKAQTSLDDASTVRMLLAMVETGSTQTSPLPDQGDFHLQGNAIVAESETHLENQGEVNPEEQDSDSPPQNPFAPKPGLHDIPGTDQK